MHLHDDMDKRSQPTRHSQGDAPPPAKAKFVIRPRATPVPRPIKGLRRPKIIQHPEMRSPDAAIVNDSLLIGLCYEAHLSMQKMLAAFAEMRGDDAADAIVNKAAIEPVPVA
jgi:hypothetical protein